MKLIFYFFVSFFLFNSPIKAETYSKAQCLLDHIERNAQRDLYVDAKGLSRNCSCISNRIKQNLEPGDCPLYNQLRGEDVRRIYKF